MFDKADALLEQIGEGTGLEFYINCNGGNCGNAFAILERLTGRADVATIHGRAVSAAYVIALTANRIVMTRGSHITIHAPVITVAGQRPRILLAAEDLDELTAKLSATLSDRRGIKHKTCYSWYADGADHVFTAEQALAAGLIDEIIEPPQMAASSAAFSIDETPTDDGRASLLMELLSALGTIRTADPDRLRRELFVWQFHNITKA